MAAKQLVHVVIHRLDGPPWFETCKHQCATQYM